MIELTQSTEDYLKAIFNLEEDEAVTTNDIAQYLNISPSSVTKMIKKLFELNYVTYESHRGVNLTEKGRLAAIRVIRRHRLIELYLYRELGFSWDEVHIEACNLEHHISEKLEDAIDKKLGYPEIDPHGDPIPNKAGVFPAINMSKIIDMNEGDDLIVKRIAQIDTDILKYFEENDIVPGSKIKLLKKHPFGGSVDISVNSETKHIGIYAAETIFVEKI